MKTIKNTAGKTICRVDLRTRQFEIVHKGCRSRIWFDDVGRFHQAHDPRTTPVA